MITIDKKQIPTFPKAAFQLSMYSAGNQTYVRTQFDEYVTVRNIQAEGILEQPLVFRYENAKTLGQMGKTGFSLDPQGDSIVATSGDVRQEIPVDSGGAMITYPKGERLITMASSKAVNQFLKVSPAVCYRGDTNDGHNGIWLVVRDGKVYGFSTNGRAAAIATPLGTTEDPDTAYHVNPSPKIAARFPKFQGDVTIRVSQMGSPKDSRVVTFEDANGSWVSCHSEEVQGAGHMLELLQDRSQGPDETQAKVSRRGLQKAVKALAEPITTGLEPVDLVITNDHLTVKSKAGADDIPAETTGTIRQSELNAVYLKKILSKSPDKTLDVRLSSGQFAMLRIHLGYNTIYYLAPLCRR